jgi:hypothetical protein
MGQGRLELQCVCLFPMVHPALKGAWQKGYGFESPLYALVQCPVETLLEKIVMCKGRPLPRELSRQCWLNLFFGLTSSLKKTKGASASHRCPQTGDRLQWNKRPVVSISGDLSNSTRSWEGVHLQYSMKRDVMDFSFPENEVQTRVGQCLPPAPHHLPHARKSLDDVFVKFHNNWTSFTHQQVDLSRERLLWTLGQEWVVLCRVRWSMRSGVQCPAARPCHYPM